MTPEWERVATFTVPGTPVPKARPRVVGRSTYTPQRTKDAEQAVAWAYCAAMGQRHSTLLDGSFAVECEFWGARATADVDNLAKLCLDALNGVCWKDDAQVIYLAASKGNATKGRARTVVTIWRYRDRGAAA